MHEAPGLEQESGGFAESAEAEPAPRDDEPEAATLGGEPIRLVPPEQPRPSELGLDSVVVRPDKRIGFGETGDRHSRAGDAALWVDHHRPHWPRFKRIS